MPAGLQRARHSSHLVPVHGTGTTLANRRSGKPSRSRGTDPPALAQVGAAACRPWRLLWTANWLGARPWAKAAVPPRPGPTCRPRAAPGLPAQPALAAGLPAHVHGGLA